jgi:DNA invertase Pin-like site-specific DNA recombinase
MKKIRCAVYTRKSSDDGLEQEFNSLHAQHEACASYIASQKHEGWVLLPEHYDDGGISGGTLERAGLQKLLNDIDEGLVDQIVVYKIDRLTRSLADFAKLVERLDAADASFVSVTQSFNTATSMGRLTLNVLLSFAQFEREVTAERIRDKIAASKKKGLWMGGNVPLGYEPDGRTLKIVEEEARTVRTLFDLYLEHGSIMAVKQHASRLGLRSKGRTNRGVSPPSVPASDIGSVEYGEGAVGEVEEGDAELDANGTASNAIIRKIGEVPLGRGHIYYILTNPIYAGRIRHAKQIYEGQQPAIIDPAVWDEVQVRLGTSAARERGRPGSRSNTSPLGGKLVDETGDHFTPSHANKKGRRYRYYISNRMIAGRGESAKATGNSGWRLPAKPLEQQLANAVLGHLRDRLPLDLLNQLSTDDMAWSNGRLDELASEFSAHGPEVILSCIERATIAPGKIEVGLCLDAVADRLGIVAASINPNVLHFSTAFQFRKRGVETKLVIGRGQGNAIDQTLVRSVAKAHQYYSAIRRGRTFEDIAASENLTKRRILQVIDLAFLAPDIVKSILQGDQPIGLTAKWLGLNPVPSDWQAQRRIIAAL